VRRCEDGWRRRMDLAVSPDEKGPKARVDLATGERVNLELLHGLLESENTRV